MQPITDRVGFAAGLDAVGVAWRELGDDARRDLAIDGCEPAAMCWPRSYHEVAQALAVADRVGAAVAPRGAGTKAALGNRLVRCDLIVSLEQLNHVVEYAPANLTVTVEAGMPLAALQASLGEAGQYLTLDPPSAARATVGGIVATNSTGPRRLAFGGPRDVVIGTRVATTSGTVVRAGGRVVKNVAGYDLNKLYVGSLGTLAILVEIGFKVSPVTADQATVIGHFARLDQLQHAVQTIARSPLQPLAVDLMNRSAAILVAGANRPEIGNGYLLATLVGAPGNAVVRQRDDLHRMYAAAGATAVNCIERDAIVRFWSDIAEWPVVDSTTEQIQLKMSVPPNAVARTVAGCVSNLSEIDNDLAIGGRAASGVLYARLAPSPPALDGSVAGTIDRLRRLRLECQESGGSLVIERAPPAIKERMDVWGDIGSGLSVMRRLKAALDPNRVLNPGRFVGGI